MLKQTLIIIALILALAAVSIAQNANTSAAGGAQEEVVPAAAQARARRRRTTGNQSASGARDSTSRGVLAAFNSLLDGIRAANVEAVAGAYWNSPQLILFNNNGTVTKGWAQMRKNRADSYPNVKDVKLDVRDVRVQMLGRGGAVVTCLWTQSQTVSDLPETATGRMTLVFHRIGPEWKAVHLHTSPDRPDPSRILPSERTPAAAATPSPQPKATP